MLTTRNLSSWIGALALCAALPELANAQVNPNPPEYQTRRSQCRHEAAPGRQVAVRRTDTGIVTSGYTAARTITLAADAQFATGDVVICSEYGNVDILDSDDGTVRLHIRMEGYGEGASDAAAEASQTIDDTELHTSITVENGKLHVRVWHSTLGFTRPGGQPTWVNVRLQLPARGAYRVRTEAFHGRVALRRVHLAGAVLRGAVGYKLKGIPGFVGGTELDNVVLSGDVDIDNLVGLPGIRAPATPQQAPLAAPILVQARIAGNSTLSAVTGGAINIAVQPDPRLGVRALAQSKTGTVRVNLDGGVSLAIAADSFFPTRQRFETSGYAGKPLRVDIRAASPTGNVTIASMPAAPLPR